jgi:hypothetical protein
LLNMLSTYLLWWILSSTKWKKTEVMMLSDNMRRGGMQRGGSSPWYIEGKRLLQITRKWLARSGEGWVVGFCLLRNSIGWVSLKTKVTHHTLNLFLNLFFPRKKSTRIIGVVLCIYIYIIDLLLFSFFFF